MKLRALLPDLNPWWIFLFITQVIVLVFWWGGFKLRSGIEVWMLFIPTLLAFTPAALWIAGHVVYAVLVTVGVVLAFTVLGIFFCFYTVARGGSVSLSFVIALFRRMLVKHLAGSGLNAPEVWADIYIDGQYKTIK